MSRTEQRRRVTKDDVRNNARESGGGKKYFKLPQGVDLWVPDKPQSYDLDFWPYVISVEDHPDRRGDKMVKGDLWYKLPFITHRQIGPSNEEVVCPTTFGRPCPVCEERGILAKNYDQNKEAIKEIKAIRNAAYVITDPRDQDKFAVFAYSTFKFGEQLDKELKDGGDDNLFFWDTTEDGRTVRVRFTEEKFEGNNFFKANRFDFNARGKYDEDQILGAVPCLDSILLIHPYDELRNLFLQIDGDGNSTAKEEKPPAGGAPASRARTTGATDAGKPATGGGSGPGGARRAPGAAGAAATPTPTPTAEGGLVDGAAVSFKWRDGTTHTGVITDVDGDNVEIESEGKSFDVKRKDVKVASFTTKEDNETPAPSPKAAGAKKAPGATTAAPPKTAPKGATAIPEKPAIKKGDTVVDDDGNTGVVTKVEGTEVTFKPEEGPKLTVDVDDVTIVADEEPGKPAGEAEGGTSAAGTVEVGVAVEFEDGGETFTGVVLEIKPNEDVVIKDSKGKKHTVDIDECHVPEGEGGDGSGEGDADEDGPLAPGDAVTWDDGDETGRVVKVKEDRVKVSNTKGEHWEAAENVKRAPKEDAD